MGSSLLHNLPRWVCGSLAGVLAVCFLYLGRNELSIVFASLFLLLICTTDTLYSKIPNMFTLLLTLSGFGLHFRLEGAVGLWTALLGLLTGFSLLLIPYLLGGMGAGDVKALAALGSLLGAGTILQVALYMFLAGGLMSVLHYLCNRNLLTQCRAGLSCLAVFLYTRDIKIFKPEPNGESLRFPYAAAIAFGFFAHTYWGDLI
ncbi:MAG: prepilin peptidase [Desulfuromonadales bacterium]|nr:prepilin peptidase [Desulfuromonadales bacterium]